MSDEEKAEEAKADVLPRKPTNREVILAALSERDSGAFMLSTEYVIDAARQNDKRPAYIRFACPDEWSKNLAGYEPLKDLYYAIRVPKEFVETLEIDN